jgi:hypothetical protein
MDMSFFSQGPYKTLHRFITAGITLSLKFLKYGLSNVTDSGQALTDIVFIRRQNPLTGFGPFIGFGRRLIQDFSDGLNAQPYGASNGFLGFLESEPAVDLVPYLLLDHWIPSRPHHRERAYNSVLHLTPFLSGG